MEFEKKSITGAKLWELRMHSLTSDSSDSETAADFKILHSIVHLVLLRVKCYILYATGNYIHFLCAGNYRYQRRSTGEYTKNEMNGTFCEHQ